MSNLEKTIAKAFLEMAEGLETGSFGPRAHLRPLCLPTELL